MVEVNPYTFNIEKIRKETDLKELNLLKKKVILNNLPLFYNKLIEEVFNTVWMKIL